MTALLDLILPRFVQEGKKYATIAIGCTGGRHRSVYLVEKLSQHLASAAPASDPNEMWLMTVVHRELAREDGVAETPDGKAAPDRVPANSGIPVSIEQEP